MLNSNIYPACRRSTKLYTMFGRLMGWYTIYTFWGHLAPNGILPYAKFTLRPSLAFSYIGSVTARHSSSQRQPNFAAWYKEWNYGTFAARHCPQKAPPIFWGCWVPIEHKVAWAEAYLQMLHRRAAVTLGIGPRSSTIYFYFISLTQ